MCKSARYFWRWLKVPLFELCFLDSTSWSAYLDFQIKKQKMRENLYVFRGLFDKVSRKINCLLLANLKWGVSATPVYISARLNVFVVINIISFHWRRQTRIKLKMWHFKLLHTISDASTLLNGGRNSTSIMTPNGLATWSNVSAPAKVG